MSTAKQISAENNYSRAACTECSRRKQKCNRQWPCNHCTKRKVADKCLFNALNPKKERPAAAGSSRKRCLDTNVSDESGSSSDSSDDESADFEALGYSAAHHFAGLTMKTEKNKKTSPKEYMMSIKSCPQLERALQVLPPRPYTDALIHNFLDNVNFHYYIIFPQHFLEQYKKWWDCCSREEPLSLQWTCLLLTVCACSAQYTDIELENKLTADLGVPVQKLTESYHNASRELHSVIPVSQNHLFNVQQLLHSCFWFKSEARFVECWHVLNAAVREAQELGLHQESAAGPIDSFEREMRRRVWCVLNTWDWQISALLGRPMIIDRSDCDVGLPDLLLDGYTPSPLLHVKLQSQLIGQLADRFTLPKYVRSPEMVQEYQRMVQRWMSDFPATFDCTKPDLVQDKELPWIVLHRHYLHTMAYSMLLDPIRAYLAKPMSRTSPPAELKIRSDGIGYALDLMKTLYGFFNHVYPRDAKLHFVLFAIFDTAAVMCSALMHDRDQSIPRRVDVTVSIQSAIDLLHRLSSVLKAAKTSHQILLRLSQKVLKRRDKDAYSRKRVRVAEASLTPPAQDQSPSDSTHYSSDGKTTASEGATNNAISTGSVVKDQPPPLKNEPTYQQEHPPVHPPPPPYVTPLPPVDVHTPPKDPNDLMATDESLMGSIPPLGPNGMTFVPQQPGFVHTTAADAFIQPGMYMELPATANPHYGELGWAGLSDAELSSFADLWNYESLDLNFAPPPVMQ